MQGNDSSLGLIKDIEIKHDRSELPVYYILAFLTFDGHNAKTYVRSQRELQFVQCPCTALK